MSTPADEMLTRFALGARLREVVLLVLPMVLVVGLAHDPTASVLAASALVLVTSLAAYGASRLVVGAPHLDLGWLTTYDAAPTSRIPDPVRHPVRPRAPGLA